MNNSAPIGLVLLLCLPAFFLSCKKEDLGYTPFTGIDSSHISITNVSPSIQDLQCYMNDRFVPLPGAPVSFGYTAYQTYIVNPSSYHPDTLLLPYININPGYNSLSFRSAGLNTTLCSLNAHFDSGANYSLFLVDTLIHGKVASVFLKDSYGKADSLRAQLRFINLSPNAPPMDIWAYPNGGLYGYLLFAHCAYLPNDFSSFLAAQNFSYIPRGPYFFLATASGTDHVLLEGQMMLEPKRLITIYAKGYVGGSGSSGLDVGVIQYDQ